MRLLFVLAAACAGLVLASPAAAACGDPETGLTLTGRTFEGKADWKSGTKRNMTLMFGADCVIIYRYTGSNAQTDELIATATWKREGDTVVLDFNRGYSTYTGTLDKGGLEGTMVSVGEDSGRFHFKPARKPLAVNGPIRRSSLPNEFAEGDRCGRVGKTPRIEGRRRQLAGRDDLRGQADLQGRLHRHLRGA